MVRHLSGLLACVLGAAILAAGAGAATPAKPDCAKLLPAAQASAIVGQHLTLIRGDGGLGCLYNADQLVTTTKKVFQLVIKFHDGGKWYRAASPGNAAFVARCNAAGATNCPSVISLGVGTASTSTTTNVENYVLNGATSLGLETAQVNGTSNLTLAQVQAIFRKIIPGTK